MPTPGHKRTLAETPRIGRALPQCLACLDTGIISNHDGMVRQFLPDYDQLPDGNNLAGIDCALVCHCLASYGEQGPDGQTQRGGYRESSGEIRTVATDAGRRFIGSELGKDQTQRLHKVRLERWRNRMRSASQPMQVMPDVRNILP